ncbi:hypothetical protein [Streptomyces sp. NPDC017413]|uniref:hypothetical protein n=1 Tax=unclassified Streptomyces TaxID=2593676 RepID=UPI00379AAB97
MSSPAPLPHVDLTATQWRLLGELVSAALPDPSRSVDSTAAAAAARGLDPGLLTADAALLTWMKLAAHSGEQLTATDLGAALHYRRLQELLELRLSEVVRYAAANEPAAPRFARNVRRLAEGSLPFADAMREFRRTV